MDWATVLRSGVGSSLRLLDPDTFAVHFGPAASTNSSFLGFVFSRVATKMFIDNRRRTFERKRFTEATTVVLQRKNTFPKFTRVAIRYCYVRNNQSGRLMGVRCARAIMCVCVCISTCA